MDDAATIYEEVRTGRANISWAVFQFHKDNKLQQLQEDNDLLAFLENLDEADPYGLREQPAIGGVKQYLIMGRDKELPFTEDGLTKKQGKDELARAMARQQLEAYAEQYPWTRPHVDAGLARAERANCHSCVEKRLVQEIATMVQESEERGYDPAGPAYPKALTEEEAQAVRPHYKPEESEESEGPTMWGAREPCPLCTAKHLAQAVVLLNESLLGYPAYRWLAIGHMAEAESEAPSLDMANRIRVIRLQAMDELELIPDFTELLEELDATIRS